MDYPILIARPMDLETIQIKLRDEQYVTVEQVLDDFQLIWDNCKTYNQQGSVHMMLCSGFMILLISWKDPSRRW